MCLTMNRQAATTSLLKQASQSRLEPTLHNSQRIHSLELKRETMTQTIYTIGYQGKSLETFITQLRGAGVSAVIDIRLRNTSHLTGYTKRDTLEFLLREGFGIGYEHRPELAPTPELLDAYQADGDWDAYVAGFLPLLDARQAEALGREVLARHRAPCLLCAEPTVAQCHRRLVAEYWAARIPELKITHL